ncbi:MAG: hypothetical protein HQK77_15890 [Desulfobacterales bacterium]|nr:hypothetical protein [Desulfobacterales bacterium]
MMKNSVKGLLFSALVFPGIGQLVLKHYKRGVIFILAVIAAIVAFLIKAVQQALVILEKIESTGGAIDMDSITIAATQASTKSDSLILQFLFFLIIFLWLFSSIDAYRIGRKKDIIS